MSVIRQPCRKCGAETRHMLICESCHAPVLYVPGAKKKREKPELEAPIKARIRAALVKAGVTVWVHNVDNRNLSTGLGRGVSDLICIVPPFGRFLAVEVKRPKLGVLSDDQERFIETVRRAGGVGGVAENETQALALLAEARQSVTLDGNATDRLT